MPILMGLEVLIQFCFAFHVLKTGRPYWWIFIIMSFPVMGCVIYYFVEVFPGSREHRRADKTVRKIVKAMQPGSGTPRGEANVRQVGEAGCQRSFECRRRSGHGSRARPRASAATARESWPHV